MTQHSSHLGFPIHWGAVLPQRPSFTCLLQITKGAPNYTQNLTNQLSFPFSGGLWQGNVASSNGCLTLWIKDLLFESLLHFSSHARDCLGGMKRQLRCAGWAPSLSSHFPVESWETMTEKISKTGDSALRNQSPNSVQPVHLFISK